MNARTIRWGMLLLAVMGILMACKLADRGINLPLTGATSTLPPTDTPPPSPTTPPSPTPPPTLAPTLPPAAPTDTPAPTQPPAAPTNPAATPAQGPENGNDTSAHVTITNQLGATIKIVLNGPSQRSFTIFGLGKREVDLVPGTYNFTITATGYYPLTGTRTFNPGDNVWNIGKE